MKLVFLKKKYLGGYDNEKDSLHGSGTGYGSGSVCMWLHRRLYRI
jgi:hypothetical protein